MLPPRHRTGRTREELRRPSSYLRFLRQALGLPPVARRLWMESREIPMVA